MGDLDVLLSGLIFLALANLYVSVKVYRDEGLTATQKALQTLIVWMLPFAGGLLVFMIHRSDEVPRTKRFSGDNAQSPNDCGAGGYDGVGDHHAGGDH